MIWLFFQVWGTEDRNPGQNVAVFTSTVQLLHKQFLTLFSVKENGRQNYNFTFLLHQHLLNTSIDMLNWNKDYSIYYTQN